MKSLKNRVAHHLFSSMTLGFAIQRKMFDMSGLTRLQLGLLRRYMERVQPELVAMIPDQATQARKADEQLQWFEELGHSLIDGDVKAWDRYTARLVASTLEALERITATNHPAVEVTVAAYN